MESGGSMTLFDSHINEKLKVEIKRQALEVNWSKLHDPLTETHITNMRERVPLMNGICFLWWNICQRHCISKADWKGITRLRNEVVQNLVWKLRLQRRIQWGRAIQLLRRLHQFFVEYSQHLSYYYFFPFLLCFQNIIPLKTHKEI